MTPINNIYRLFRPRASASGHGTGPEHFVQVFDALNNPHLPLKYADMKRENV
jgi:hypothetical protein